jgi:hypothetical protein
MGLIQYPALHRRLLQEAGAKEMMLRGKNRFIPQLAGATESVAPTDCTYHQLLIITPALYYRYSLIADLSATDMCE